MSTARFREAHVGGCTEAVLETRANGTQVLRSTEVLGWHIMLLLLSDKN